MLLDEIGNKAACPTRERHSCDWTPAPPDSPLTRRGWACTLVCLIQYRDQLYRPRETQDVAPSAGIRRASGGVSSLGRHWGADNRAHGHSVPDCGTGAAIVPGWLIAKRNGFGTAMLTGVYPAGVAVLLAGKLVFAVATPESAEQIIRKPSARTSEIGALPQVFVYGNGLECESL